MIRPIQECEERLAQLQAADVLLRDAAALVPPRIARQTSEKIRAARRSMQGAIRNAEGHLSRARCEQERAA